MEEKNIFNTEENENTTPAEEQDSVAEQNVEQDSTQESAAEIPAEESTSEPAVKEIFYEEPEETPENEGTEKAQNTYYNPNNSYYSYQATTVTPEKPKKKKNGLMIALIVVSVMLIISIIGSMATIIYLTVDDRTVSTDEQGQVVLGGSADDNDTTTVDVIEQSKEDSQQMSVEQVVKNTIEQVVGIVVTSGEGFYASEGQGSGIILSSDGYIITNAHVIEDATTVQVVLADEAQTTYDAKVIGSDSKTDLAVLKVEATDLNAADIGNSEELNLGETVIAIGNPYGLELQSSVTSGIVSALNRTITTDTGKMTLIQTDAAINPGNSGGALVNLYGQVVGICSSKISDVDAEGLGFAIPISEAIPIVKELISQGYISGRPMIGIQCQDISTQTSMMYGVPTGVYVIYVDETSSAYKEGLRQYDIITEFNNETVTCYSDLDVAMDECVAGDEVSLTFYRYSTGKYHTISITLSEATGSN